MARRVEGTLGFGLGGMALLGFLAASVLFIPELLRYIKIKRM
jgi:hypothetical protein